MFQRHKFTLFWLAYLVVVVLGLSTAAWSGLLALIWIYDVTYLSSIILLAWFTTEAIGGVQIVRLGHQISLLQQGQPVESVSESQLWTRHGFVNFMGEIIVAAGIFGTVIGVVVALMPFFAMTSFQLALIQPQLLHMFAGIAVAFFPTALSILIKIALDFHSRLHQIAVNSYLVLAQAIQ